MKPSRIVPPGTQTEVITEPRALKGDLDTIVLMALRKEPERRYSSAGEFAADIERYQGMRPIRARRNALAYTSVRFVQRQKKTITMAFVVAACFSLITWEIAKYHYQSEAERGSERVQQLIARDQARQGQANNFPGLRADLRQFSAYYQDTFGSYLGRHLIPAEQRRKVVADGFRYLAWVSPEGVKDREASEALARAYLTLAEIQNRGNDPRAARSICETALNRLGPALAQFANSQQSSQYSKQLAELANRLGALLRSLNTP